MLVSKTCACNPVANSVAHLLLLLVVGDRNQTARGTATFLTKLVKMQSNLMRSWNTVSYHVHLFFYPGRILFKQQWQCFFSNCAVLVCLTGLPSSLSHQVEQFINSEQIQNTLCFSKLFMSQIVKNNLLKGTSFTELQVKQGLYRIKNLSN